MNITTMLNAMHEARRQLEFTGHYKYLAQYHFFRDGIRKRWLRMEIDLELAQWRCEFWKDLANGEEPTT